MAQDISDFFLYFKVKLLRLDFLAYLCPLITLTGLLFPLRLTFGDKRPNYCEQLVAVISLSILQLLADKTMMD